MIPLLTTHAGRKGSELKVSPLSTPSETWNGSYDANSMSEQLASHRPVICD